MHLVAQRVSPASLYFVGLAPRENKLCSELGKVTEEYVSEHLDLVNPPVVLHDVEHKKGQHTAAYVIGYSGLRIIMEAKSARVVQPGRLDVDGYLADAEKYIGKAMKQITSTRTLSRPSTRPSTRSTRPPTSLAST
ncbi:hypothetical protein [Plantactinospora mayteni]|uniref:hypothetical protein n=1 Tax=Plantactinospora mayteni TaxID=566021 RepID=UPI001943A02B|nr:hypothetical protein [Plantactinospora mayteni]